MAYLGQSPVVGRYSLCDDISSGFNGSETDFSLTASSVAIKPGTARNLLLSLGGVIQKPETNFTVSGSTLTFTTPPTAGLAFFALILGDAYAVGTPSDSTVLPASISSGYQLGTVDAQKNTLLGTNSGNSFTGTDAVNNTLIGYDVGTAITTGDNNTAIGYQAGDTLATGSNNVYIGSGAADTATDTSNEVVLWNGTKQARFQGSDTAWAFSSDGRDKTDVEDLNIGLNLVNKLKPRKFTWNPRDEKRSNIRGNIRSGFIAQEVLETVNELDIKFTTIVNTDNSDHYLVSESAMIPMLVKSIQELSEKISILEAK